jgi:cobalt-zinc-cadmium efflux system outer membrane protein
MKKLLYMSALVVLLWQPSFAGAESLDKQAALRMVLKNNPTYIAALANIDAAEGSRLQASFLPNPNAIFEIENFAGQDEQESFDGAEITLGIEQTIEMGGKRESRINVADFDYKISQQQAKAQALSLLAETEYAFIRVAVAQERIALADKRLTLADKTHSIVKKRVGAAKAAEIQHTKADIERAAAEVEKRKAQKQHVNAQNDLARLIGVMDASSLDVQTNLAALPKLIEQQAVLDALKNAPQSQAQEFAKMQARSSLDLARSQAVPDPTFGLGVRRFNESDNTALVANLSFPIPVFNRNQGDIQKAKANMAKADAQSHAASLSLRQSAIQAWENFSSSLEETSHYQNEIIPSARRAYSQANDGYGRGAFTFLDLLDAQRTLYEVQEARLDSLLSVYEAKAQTDFLMGTHSALITQISQIVSKGQNDE